MTRTRRRDYSLTAARRSGPPTMMEALAYKSAAIFDDQDEVELEPVVLANEEAVSMDHTIEPKWKAKPPKFHFLENPNPNCKQVMGAEEEEGICACCYERSQDMQAQRKFAEERQATKRGTCKTAAHAASTKERIAHHTKLAIESLALEKEPIESNAELRLPKGGICSLVDELRINVQMHQDMFEAIDCELEADDYACASGLLTEEARAQNQKNNNALKTFDDMLASDWLKVKVENEEKRERNREHQKVWEAFRKSITPKRRRMQKRKKAHKLLGKVAGKYTSHGTTVTTYTQSSKVTMVIDSDSDSDSD